MTWITNLATVHVVGIGGAGMSGVARLLAERGLVVSGCDAVESATTAELRAVGVTVDIGHDAHHVAGADVVLWSPAIDADLAELVAALDAGARLVSRGELLADLGECQAVIGLAGTHGKTTATSMMVHVLHAAGRDDGRLLGAPVLGVGANGHFGPDGLVLEVDESYGTFASLSPAALGLLNVEADHLDHYHSMAALDSAFAGLVDRTTGPVVVWSDDTGVARVGGRVRHPLVTVGLGPESRWRVSDVRLERRWSRFSLTGPRGDLEVELRVTGAHNVANAAVVAVLALDLDVAPVAVTKGLGVFRGAPRRFQLLGTWRGADVYEDYAHLPGEISATLSATRAIGYERVTAVFQPHRVTRTAHLADQFAPSFDLAARVIVTDIYSVGEPNPAKLTGEIVAQALRSRRGAASVVYAPTLDDVAAALETLHDQSDAVLLLGAGNVASVAARLDVVT